MSGGKTDHARRKVKENSQSSESFRPPNPPPPHPPPPESARIGEGDKPKNATTADARDVPVGKDLGNLHPLLVALAIAVRPTLMGVALGAVDHPMVPARPPEGVALVRPSVEAVVEGYQAKPQKAAYVQGNKVEGRPWGRVQNRESRQQRYVMTADHSRLIASVGAGISMHNHQHNRSVSVLDDVSKRQGLVLALDSRVGSAARPNPPGHAPKKYTAHPHKGLHCPHPHLRANNPKRTRVIVLVVDKRDPLSPAELLHPIVLAVWVAGARTRAVLPRPVDAANAARVGPRRLEGAPARRVGGDAAAAGGGTHHRRRGGHRQRHGGAPPADDARHGWSEGCWRSWGERERDERNG